MLKLWDGISVDQEAREVTIRADIALPLLDKLVQMLNSGANGRGRATSGRDRSTQL